MPRITLIFPCADAASRIPTFTGPFFSGLSYSAYHPRVRSLSFEEAGPV